jgi:NAD(P)-dependent dehydrogenase (short-subunit alcohol dehydrogenase family)
MTEQIRLCLPVRRAGIRSITALRILQKPRAVRKIKFFYPNGRWWHIPGNCEPRKVQSGDGYPGCGLAPQDGHKTRPRKDPEMNVPGTNDQRDLDGLSALVTGATSGIGRAAAEELGRHGAEIVVHGRDAGRGSAVVDTITVAGGKARFVAADLTDPAQVDHLAEQAGPVDVLVNNAGFAWFGPTAELDVPTFDRLFAANVRAAYFLVAALGPKMAARGSGSIISTGSMAGQIGLAGGAAYSATKATLAAMTRSWAAEFSPSGVRVNAVAAGPVLTSGAAPDRIEALGATTLLARPAQPGEIASLIAFLASPKASYITGAVIAADGGRTAI